MAEKLTIPERDTVEALKFLKEAFEIEPPKEKRDQTTPIHNERRQRDHIECELF
jgi:hypothetical protein